MTRSRKKTLDACFLSLRIDPGAGFRWDRQWMLVNSKGRGCTQRVEPKLALIQVELPPEAFAEDWQPTPEDHMGMGSLLNFSVL